MALVRLVASVSYDKAGNPLSGSITRYRNGLWDGCVVRAAEPFESTGDLIRELWMAWDWAYGEQLQLNL